MSPSVGVRDCCRRPSHSRTSVFVLSGLSPDPPRRVLASRLSPLARLLAPSSASECSSCACCCSPTAALLPASVALNTTVFVWASSPSLQPLSSLTKRNFFLEFAGRRLLF
ncbi:hypothetical protein HN51_044907, partial [Arachis hypogaea]